MEFEQLTLYDQPLTNDIKYHTLDNDGKIYTKIDWMTVMFFDCSMQDVLKWIKLGDAVTDFCTGFYQRCRGFDTNFFFAFNGVTLETSDFNFYGQDIDVSLFDVVVPKIRLELSGTGLDYLRSRVIDMDSYCKVPPILPDGGSYHFTRVDYAFDFINYCPEFVDKMIDHINTHKLPSERVPVLHLNGGIKAKVVTGGQKTVYLGSPQSDRMLRVYDKRMQYVDLGTGVYKKSNPYGDPDSWIRIEWQCRNQFANDLVFSDLEHKHILKEIFERYAFTDGTVSLYKRKPVDFWLKLFEWEDVEKRIIQNAKYVISATPSEEVINRFEKVMLRTFIFYFMLRGRKGLQDACNNYLLSLYGDDPVSMRRYTVFFNKLNALLEDTGYFLSSESPEGVGLFNNCGRLGFRL